MLVWRGAGILVVVFAVAGLIAGDYAAAGIWGATQAADHKAASMLMGLLLAAALVFGMHFLLERSGEQRTFIDKATGQEVIVKPKHDLFFIPVKYWSFVLAAVGVFVFFKG